VHLQQTTDASRKSGGPQYYFHSIPDPIRGFLRSKGACDVVLETPYGITVAPFIAVSKDHKWEDGKIKPGKVGHDRIQQSGATESIGEAIRKWYCLPSGDFEKINVEAEIVEQKLHSGKKTHHFVIRPIGFKIRGKKLKVIPSASNYLSIHANYESALWKKQLRSALEQQPKEDIQWAFGQIKLVVDDHLNRNYRNLHEADILRVSGALNIFGVQLGPYRTKDYDCDPSFFKFQNFPVYECPVEIKKQSVSFKYQETKYSPLPRAVVLCLEHNHQNIPKHIDVIELRHFEKVKSSLLGL
jgi:hypothetical protein